MTESSARIPLQDHPVGCPLCGNVTGVRTIGSEHWAYCETHLTAWWIGSGVFAGTRPHTEASLRANIRFLSDYRVLDDDVQSGTAEPEDRS